jgi:hypothetical protein
MGFGDDRDAINDDRTKGSREQIMATDADRAASASEASAVGIKTVAAAEGGIDLDVVERELRKLLRAYRFALQYASDMPSLGRSAVKPGLPRFGSRFWTRVYVQTHVRKQLLAIGDCLRLSLLDSTDADQTARLNALGDELDAHSAPLFRWRRLTGLVSRLPPVAAALPVVSAASAWPLAGEVTRRTLLEAFLVLLATALLLWIVVVWPSVRFGFRVKRVIFGGGVEAGRVRNGRIDTRLWYGFTVPRYNEDGSIADEPKAFPTENVYLAENRVYDALERRKPAEVPLDLLLSFTPYIWTAYSIFFFWGLVNAITTHTLPEASSWGGLVIAGGLALGPLFYPSGARRLYRNRPH